MAEGLFMSPAGPILLAQAEAPTAVGLPAMTAEPATAGAPPLAVDTALPAADGAPTETILVEDTPAAGFNIGRALDLIEVGGPVVTILIVLSIAALAIIVRKLIQLLPLSSRKRAIAARAVDIWREGRQPEGLAAMKRADGPTAATVSSAMVLVLQRIPTDVVREEVERIAGEELHRLRRYLRGLEAIAQVSPLLGLFGTILGMIEAFRVLQEAGAQVDPSMLAGGIWVALLTTAVGLAVAIPCNLALHWFDGRIDLERQSIESLATAVLTSAETHRPLAEMQRAAEPARAVPLPLAAHAH